MNAQSEAPPSHTVARPQPPEKPLPSDCCDSGCDPCVMDSYLDELAAYEKALANWQRMQDGLERSGR